MPKQPNSAILLLLTLPKRSKQITQMPIKKHYHSIRIYYIHLLPQQLKRTPAPPVEFPSQLVAQRVRRIHPTYLLEFDDGETMEVDQPTKVPVRPERPGGLSWDSDILWVCCWGHL